jgi:hypothetical protein
MFNGLKEIWQVLNGPGNDAVVVGLLLGWLGLFVSHFTMLISYRRVLSEKDRRIEDIVEQRNLFQEIVLTQKGLTRVSTKARK